MRSVVTVSLVGALSALLLAPAASAQDGEAVSPVQIKQADKGLRVVPGSVADGSNDASIPDILAHRIKDLETVRRAEEVADFDISLLALEIR